MQRFAAAAFATCGLGLAALLSASARAGEQMIPPGATAADWLTAVGTLILATVTIVLAVVAIFQDSIRGRFYRPILKVSILTKPPDCNAVPLTTPDGQHIADSFYFRLWIRNIGNATANNVEVYANELLRRRADDTLEKVAEFPPMNLSWSHIHKIYFPVIVPGMGKHCDLAHIVDPALRSHSSIREENPKLKLTVVEASLAFDLIVAPNDKGHIIGPGDYHLKISIAAANARPVAETISITLSGKWTTDEATMLRDEVGVTIRPT